MYFRARSDDYLTEFGGREASFCLTGRKMAGKVRFWTISNGGLGRRVAYIGCTVQSHSFFSRSWNILIGWHWVAVICGRWYLGSFEVLVGWIEAGGQSVRSGTDEPERNAVSRLRRVDLNCFIITSDNLFTDKSCVRLQMWNCEVLGSVSTSPPCRSPGSSRQWYRYLGAKRGRHIDDAPNIMYLHIHLPCHNPPDQSLHFLTKSLTFEYDRKHIAKASLVHNLLQGFAHLQASTDPSTAPSTTRRTKKITRILLPKKNP